jgi:hypothetical protein
MKKHRVGVSFPELECLASKKVENWSSSDTAAVAFGIALAVLVVSIFGLCFLLLPQAKEEYYHTRRETTSTGS